MFDTLIRCTTHTAVAAVPFPAVLQFLMGTMKRLLVPPYSVLSQRFASSSRNKVYNSTLEALRGIKDGSKIVFSGFGLCGIPENLITSLTKLGPKELICVSNDAGVGDFGFGELLANNQVRSLTASFLGEHKTFLKVWKAGNVELHLVPQGTLAEKLRAGGAGIPAFYSPAGVGTAVQSGQLPVRYDAKTGEVDKYSTPKEVRHFNGRDYVLEESITADYAIIKAWKGDKEGNLKFRGTARNFNPDCAKAAKITIVEVEELVEVGELAPDEIHLPGIYVNRIVVGERYTKRIEKLTIRKTDDTGKAVPNAQATPLALAKERIARRAARELKDGMYANIGIGIPTLVSNYLPKNIKVELHSENGLLGTGPYPLEGHADADIINAGKETVTYLPGSSTFASSESFAMIRGKHIDITILGALEISATGDLANWIIPGKSIKGMGGAMDLVAACERVVVATTHCTKLGHAKILQHCSLPLTGKGVVDMIITELAVFKVHRGKGLELIEHAPGVTVDLIRQHTAAKFEVSSHLREMLQ